MLAPAAPVTGWFFYIDAQNVYSRRTWFIGYAVVQFLLLGASLIPLIGAARKSTARTYWTLVFFPVIAFAGGLLQSLAYGLVLIWPVTTVFLVAAALNIQKDQIGIDHLTGISNRLLFDEMLEALPPYATNVRLHPDGSGRFQANQRHYETKRFKRCPGFSVESPDRRTSWPAMELMSLSFCCMRQQSLS
ncbi:hypothetical protein [Sphaerochaeta sp. UBA5836]|uniref:hypothetical protein n=1 Tax=Sphaerochaeta sp. UBA5836 TaxID=1947474 RepID=UPI0025E06DBD|nr:hypothetical protein [Sphaerochaeta sp. UBA5836]